MFASRGKDVLTSSVGRDSFCMVTAELPEKVNTITDFELGVDKR
ncbi:hypothetical protein [Myxosarcina sp. GI1(2024)]